MGEEILVVLSPDADGGPARHGLSALLARTGLPFRLASLGGSAADSWRGALVSYGARAPQVPEACSQVHVVSSGLLSAGRLLSRAQPAGAVALEGVPVPGATAGATPPVARESPRRIVVHQDVVAATVLLLSRREELLEGGPLDQKGRFPASSSAAGVPELLERPLVEQYAALLVGWLRELLPAIEPRPRSWHGKEFALALTHDLDNIRRYESVRSAALRGVTREGWRKAAREAARAARVCWLGRRDPFDNLQDVLSWERDRGIRSSINVMPSTGPGDANFDLDSPGLIDLLRRASADGWEMGFHPGRRTAVDFERFREQKEAAERILGLPIVGGRQHVLEFRVPHTWRIWEQAGLLYDSTVGYADRPGFRAGTCLPYRPWDLLEGREMDLWELPLIVMDDTLDSYLKLPPEEAEILLDRLLGSVRRQRGVLTLLWHNTYFGSENGGRWHSLLAGLVEKAQAQGAFVGPPREVLAGYDA